jgi:lipid-binding SYLF domain-containing protein
MRRIWWGTALGRVPLLGLVGSVRADRAGELAERLRKATSVLGEMASGKEETAIPRAVLSRARAVAVFPQVKKGAVIVGGRQSLLKSATTLGGDVSLTAVPKSRHDAANTDGSFKSEIFSYARSTGFIAGASFEGATVQPDGGAIRTLDGAKADSRDVRLAGRYPVPVSAQSFVKALTTYSPPPKKR